MILRGIDFGPVLDASGVRGFFGEGYWYHKYLRLFGLNLKGCSFVSKTTTLWENKGNIPLKKDGITPRDRFPKCIKIYPIKGGGMVLNAVGLSGPGAEALFEDGRWQKWKTPFFISFASIAGTPEERIDELRLFVKMFEDYLKRFSSPVPVGLQIDYSCPNVHLKIGVWADEIIEGLKIAKRLEIPLMPKFSVIVSPTAVKKISDSPYCDAVCVSNAVSWGKIPDEINRKKLFGTNESPLAEFGGGGLSGRPLLIPLINWILEARKVGIKKPINAGGGILDTYHVNVVYHALSDYNSSIFVGSVTMLRPWRVKGIIKRAHQLFGKEKM